MSVTLEVGRLFSPLLTGQTVLEKAAASGADAFFIDLEDAAAREDKGYGAIEARGAGRRRTGGAKHGTLAQDEHLERSQVPKAHEAISPSSLKNAVQEGIFEKWLPGPESDR